jgi:basic amino acid/polyamine antiporter, APA family
MEKSIWRRKPMSAYEADIKNNQLKKIMGKWSLTAIGIGGIIGGGIFVLTGTAAHYHAGPALALSFVAGIGCIFAALCYSEFASMLPVEGSAYAYAYGTIGELFAWIIGWGLILEYAMGAMTVAVSWSGYFNKLLHLFGINIPENLRNDPFTYANFVTNNNIVNPASFSFNLPAFLITWLVTWILVKGMKEARDTNNLIVILKLAAILFVIFVGIFFVNVGNWQPFIPAPEMVMHEDGIAKEAYGIKGILSGAAAIFFAYIGFDVVSTSAGEAINPKKDIPFAIIASLLICTVLYILVSMVLTGMLNYKEITGDALKAPVAYAFDKAGQPWAVFIITAAATAGLVSVMLVMMLGQTRVFLGMAKDGLLPDFFSQIHPNFKTPWKSTILVGFLVSVVASFTPIGVLSDMTSFGTLFAFAMVCLAVLILRFRDPERERPFKTPMLTLIAPLGIITNIALMSLLDSKAQKFAIAWMVLGLLVYFAYSRNKSNLNKM